MSGKEDVEESGPSSECEDKYESATESATLSDQEYSSVREDFEKNVTLNESEPTNESGKTPTTEQKVEDENKQEEEHDSDSCDEDSEKRELELRKLREDSMTEEARQVL